MHMRTLVRSISLTGVALAFTIPFGVASAQDVDLVWYSTPNPGTEWEAATRAWLSQYEERTGVSVRLEVGGYAEHQNRIVIGHETGTLPDIVQMWPAFSAPLIVDERLLPLDEMIEDMGNPFFEAAANAAAFEGAIYGLPQFADVRPLVYRKDIFAELGLEPPDSWEEFLEVGKALTRDTNGDGNINQWGYASTFIEHRAVQSYWPFMFGFGGGLLDDDLRPTFNHPGNVEALEFVASLMYEHEISPTAMRSLHLSEILAGLGEGRYAMSIQGGFVVGHMEEFYEDRVEDIGFHLLPEPPNAPGVGAFLGGQQLGISSNTQHPDEAKALLRAYMEEFAEEFWLLTGYVPTMKAEFLENDVFGQEPMTTLVAALGQAEPEGRPLPDWPQLLELLNVAVQETLTQQRSAKEALDHAQSEALAVIER